MRTLLSLTACALVAAPAAAETVQVTVTGVVEYNDIFSGEFAAVSPNDPAVLTFQVDSDVFVDHPTVPTRGYVIDQSSYSLTLGGVVVGVEDPFPAGDTPYFVIRNDDPAVDGFFVATSLSADIGVPSDVPGSFGQFVSNWKATYGGDLLSSLDILDAQGTYDFTGLTVFNWAIEDGPFSPLGMVFDEFTIGTAGCPPADLDGSGDVGFSDILRIIANWGFCPGCPEDLNGNFQADFADILIVIASWGACGGT